MYQIMRKCPILENIGINSTQKFAKNNRTQRKCKLCFLFLIFLVHMFPLSLLKLISGSFKKIILQKEVMLLFVPDDPKSDSKLKNADLVHQKYVVLIYTRNQINMTDFSQCLLVKKTLCLPKDFIMTLHIDIMQLTIVQFLHGLIFQVKRIPKEIKCSCLAQSDQQAGILWNFCSFVVIAKRKYTDM